MDTKSRIPGYSVPIREIFKSGHATSGTGSPGGQCVRDSMMRDFLVLGNDLGRDLQCRKEKRLVVVFFI